MGSKNNRRKKTLKATKSLEPNLLQIPQNGDHDKIILSIFGHLSAFNKQNNYRSIRKLASNVKIPSTLKNIYSIKQQVNAYDISKYLSSSNYFYWLIGLFENNKNILNSFCKYREEFNTELLFGDHASCLEILDKIDELSISWWSFETRLHVLKEFLQGDTKKTIEERTSVLGEINHVRIISRMCEGSVEIHTKILTDQLTEYKTSGIKNAINYGECLRLLYMPHCRSLPAEHNPINFEILSEYHGNPIIDQYILFKSVIASYAGDFSSLAPHKISIIKEIVALTNDKELNNIIEETQSNNEFVNNTLDLYTSGDYSSVIEEIRKHNSRNVLGLIEVHARAKAYLTDRNSDNLFEKLTLNISDILQLKPETEEKINSLITICNKFRHEAWAKCLHYHMSKILHEKHDKNQIEALRIQSLVLGNLNTPKVLIKDFIPEVFKTFDSLSLPLDRILKYQATEQMMSSITRAMFPIASDFLKLQSKIYFDRGDYSSLSTFICKNYYRNKLTHIYLPLAKACQSIRNNCISDYDNYIKYIIVTDIYSKTIGKKFDELRSDLFETYINKSHSHEPSKIFDISTVNLDEIYFLRYICTPNQLDNIIYFVSDDEVVIERVAIIDFLINYYKQQKNKNEIINLLEERNTVLESLFAENLRAKLETGKLYVDVQEIFSRNKHIYESFYMKAKSLPGGILLDPLGNSFDEADAAKDIYRLDDDKSVTASSKKMELIVNLYYQCARDFAASEEYGLDKYLSAEIRHNVFFGQIRSCFEKSNLVTEHSDEGYASNNHWMQKYNYVNKKIMAMIDRRLMTFSELLDGYINSFNNRLRVVTHNESDAIFDYSCYYARAADLSQIIHESSDFNSFFQDMIEFMWGIAESYAKQCQQLIDGEFKQTINNYIDSLEVDLRSLKSKAAIVNLMDEVRLVRSTFSNEIENVCNWFRFVGKSDRDESETTEVVIEATVSSFLAIYGHRDQKLTTHLGKSNTYLKYREARSLFISLFTALENAFNYCTPETPIVLEYNSDIYSNDIITVTNYTNTFSNQEQASVFISDTKRIWQSNNVELNVLEGGTGLYKIYDYLHKCSNRFSVDIKIPVDLNLFILTVTIKDEHSDN